MKDMILKTKFRFPLNLQLFAEDDDDQEPEFEIEDDEDLDDEDIELEDDDEQDDPEDDDQDDVDDDAEDNPDIDPEDKGKKQQAGKGKNETAAAVIAERKKWQAKLQKIEQEAAVAKRFMSQIGVADLDEMNRRMDAFEAEKLAKQGVPADLAERMARSERQLKEQERDIRRQKFAFEAERLKADPFYADLEDYREELEELAERAGMSLKAAYLSQHGDRRIKERETEIETKVKANKEKRAAKKVDTSPTGSNSNKSTRRVNLSADERAIAKAAGMTPEEYAKFKRR